MTDRRRSIWWAPAACVGAAVLILCLIVASSAGQAKIDPSLVTSVSTESAVAAMAFTPDGKTLAVRLGTGTVQLRNTATGTVRATLGPAGQPNPTSLAVSPDGKEIAIGVNTSSGFESTIEEISVATGKVTASVQISEYEAYSVAFSPDGKTLAIAAGRQLVFWNLVTHTTVVVGTFTPISEIQGDAFYVSFSSDGKSLAVASNDGLVKLWDVPKMGFTKSTTVGFTKSTTIPPAINGATISPDGTTVALSVVAPLGNDSETWLWYPATGKTVMLGTANSIGALAYSPDGKLLATGDDTGAIQVWDTATRGLIATEQAPSRIIPVTATAFSPDGRSLATAQSLAVSASSGLATIQLWDLYPSAGRRHRRLPETGNGDVRHSSPSGRASPAPSALPPGLYHVGTNIGIVGSWVMTLDSIEVTESGQAIFNIATTNNSTVEGQLSCAVSPTPVRASIVLSTGQVTNLVAAATCSDYPGDTGTISIPAQGFLHSDAVFASSQGLSHPFTFVWSGPAGLSARSDIRLSDIASTTKTFGSAGQGTASGCPGIGQVRPPEVWLAGDATQDVVQITWSSWGGAQAAGKGMALDPNSASTVAAMRLTSVDIVAFDLSPGGQFYQKFEFFFPQYGQSFSPSSSTWTPISCSSRP